MQIDSTLDYSIIDLFNYARAHQDGNFQLRIMDNFVAVIDEYCGVADMCFTMDDMRGSLGY